MSDSGHARKIRVLDTTLRDGDQSAYGVFSVAEKLAVARLLDAAGIDCIETGFPSSSAVDLEACRLISSEGLKSDIAVMCRAIPAEIDLAASVLPPSNGIIHLTLPVSDILMRAKLGKTKRETIALARESVRRAARLASLVEMGAEDATRAEYGFLVDYCAAVIDEGARIVNIADTVGKSTHEDFAALIRNLVRDISAFASGNVILGVHCHNDLGLASANGLAGLLAGAAQVETTLLGIGERAGNAATEELAAIIALSGAHHGIRANLDPEKLADAARTVGTVLGLPIFPFKPVVGRNARVHASGTHQQAETRLPGAYDASSLRSEVVAPTGSSSVPSSSRIVLSRHSGRAGIIAAAARYAGVTLGESDALAISAMIKALPDGRGAQSRTVGITEFVEILRSRGFDVPEPWKLRNFAYAVKDVGIVECRVTVACVGKTRRLRATATSLLDALIAMASKLCPTSIALSSSTESSVFAAEVLVEPGGLSTPSRVYIEAVATGLASGDSGACNFDRRLYFAERTGIDRLRLLFECLLDVVNAERCTSRLA